MRESDMLKREVERVKSAAFLEIVDASGSWRFIRIDSADGSPFHTLPEDDRAAMLDEHVHWDEYERSGIDTLAARSEAIRNPYPEGYDPDFGEGPTGREAEPLGEDGYRLAPSELRAAGSGVKAGR